MLAHAIISLILFATPAEQARRTEDLYWKVMARCCIRKPGALKIHQQIEKQVAEGQSDEAILADFNRRFGGQPVNLDQAPDSGRDADTLLIVPVVGTVSWALWGLRNRRRNRV